ncbi:MAG: hypothetical protein IJ134_02325 [Bacilli bacterium]|nr:hypothetical protein [Bacilli bacterium]
MNNENNGVLNSSNEQPNLSNQNSVPVGPTPMPSNDVTQQAQPQNIQSNVVEQPIPVVDNTVSQPQSTQEPSVNPTPVFNNQSLNTEEVTVVSPEPSVTPVEQPIVEPKVEIKPEPVMPSNSNDDDYQPKKRSKAVPFLVFIIIILIIGLVGMYLYYNGYLDKYIGKASTNNTSEKEEKTTSPTVSYNKDGEFIKSLMDKILYKDYYSHDEFQLYSKDIVKVDDLSDNYKNNLIVLNMRKNTTEVSSISESNLMQSSKNLFGKNIYSVFPEKLEILCKTFTHDVSNKMYTKDLNSGGCGGTGYSYLDYITKVESDDQNIYVYQKVAFQGKDGIYKNVSVKDNSYSTSEILVEYKQNTIEFDFDVEKNLDKMNEYKFSFKYDKENNIYYFESVEKVK